MGFVLYLLARKRANNRRQEHEIEPDPREDVPEAGQPYLQSKAELDAEETTKMELEAKQRNEQGQGKRYETAGDGFRAEMTRSNEESGVLPSLMQRHELRGEEHSRELDGHDIEPTDVSIFTRSFISRGSTK